MMLSWQGRAAPRFVGSRWSELIRSTRSLADLTGDEATSNALSVMRNPQADFESLPEHTFHSLIELETSRDFKRESAPAGWPGRK